MLTLIDKDNHFLCSIDVWVISISHLKQKSQQIPCGLKLQITRNEVKESLGAQVTSSLSMKQLQDHD